MSNEKLKRELEADIKHLTNKCERYIDKWVLACDSLLRAKARLRKLKQDE